MFSTLSFMVAAVMLLVGLGLILLAGRQPPPLRVFGTATPARACLEVGLIGLGLASPVIVVDALALLGLWSDQVTVWASPAWHLFSWLAPIFYSVVLPVWMCCASRHRPEPARARSGSGMRVLAVDSSSSCS